MVLLRKTLRQTSVSKVWNTAKRFGSLLFVAGFIMGNKGSCLGGEEKTPEPVQQEEVADAPIDISGKYTCKVVSSKGKGRIVKQLGGIKAPYWLNIRKTDNGHIITKSRTGYRFRSRYDYEKIEIDTGYVPKLEIEYVKQYN